VPPFFFPRFFDLPIRLSIMLDAERLMLFMVLLSWPLMLFLFLPFLAFFDLPITLDIILLAARLMDLYVFRALRLKGVNI